MALEPDQEVIPAGLLKLARRGSVESAEFAYGRRYLELPIAIAFNPGHLPLKGEAMSIPERRIRDGGALPLTFRDALPDSWGRRVLEAQYGKILDDIDALLMTNTDRIGAMVFSETIPIQTIPADENIASLEELSDAVRRLELSQEISTEMRRLLHRGGTLGGARPKSTFIHENQRWIAKFPAISDDHDVELLEISILKLAEKCGIEVSPAILEKIPKGHTLLLRRFDREGFIGNERRIHYLSASALLDVAYESAGGSYIELAQVLRRISVDPKYDLDQLYRRMVFNLIIDNNDDHVKNHGVLHVEKGKYRLAPAFDLVMQLTNIGYQELAIKPGNNLSSIKLAKEAAPHFGINEKTAEDIIKSIEEIVDDELINIVLHYGGNNQLIGLMMKCLERQRDMIYKQ
ncbi:MAG: type II toxin-antitoxin system HipA family toxin [Methylotenera sp.]|nr:type II toxin-antitoxin system HipA family toxin [Methylotenera sp.]